jgi:alkanesulfonate monooxygenase SsuD/methylene tetrahydromethanopterin reductase-like flavin-dependent oxidoreductase (luciferase family)
MKFGVFDHIDANGMSGTDQYAHRLALVARYEALGFHAYHVAEHHATPLGLAPSPGLFLAAVAQRTTTLRFGPLVYLLPLYHPVRLLEEIGMLDQLSGGRLQIGIGRGGQPAEHARFGLDPAELDARFEEGLEILQKGLASDVLRHDGRFWQIPDTPQRIKPVQRPHPPYWYGTGNPARADWAARLGINLVCNQSDAKARAISDAFGEALARHDRAGADQPFMGVARLLYVAPTDAEAERIAARAWACFAQSFNWLVNWLGRPVFPLPAGFAAAQAAGMAFAGSPQSVREWVAATRAAAGIDYLLIEPVFGDMSHAEALQGVELFGAEVMPAFAD